MSHHLLKRLDRNALRLFLCGAAILFWELAIIRWFGATLRIVSYYSNFVLMAAFFGLGLGALLARFQVRLHRLVFPVISLALLFGLAFSSAQFGNFGGEQEFVWIGASAGVMPEDTGQLSRPIVHPMLVLSLAYVAAAAVFVVFGQWIGRLFKTHEPLWAYSFEVAGSIAGIGAFALCSWAQLSPPVWFFIGFSLLLFLTERRIVDIAVGVVCAATVLVMTLPYAQQMIWSPYYKISAQPLTRVIDPITGNLHEFGRTLGHTLTVNNDYHQMMLDLSPTESGATDHPFVSQWRELYDMPYREMDSLPEGPILVVGAGTGNDVAAALRNTDRDIYAVDIDPAIVSLGQRFHTEKPYENPRVHVEINDARSFFQNTDQRFAMVVFGFLDSHTLLSNLSSLRLDNYVYTEESLARVRDLLRPDGRVALTFASNNEWLHQRFIGLLDSTFDQSTRALRDEDWIYPNGVVYVNARSNPGGTVIAKATNATVNTIPTDDWPFLYMRTREIPDHYLAFLGFSLLLGLFSLRALPSGQRRVRLSFFFLGAAFFLVETSNVISLSLLFGSTWSVNVTVFIGVLALVLLGNLTLLRFPRLKLWIAFAALTLSLALAWLVPTDLLLGIASLPLRAVAAVAVFLGPVYFASLIFAYLIRREDNLYQAYGSNVLGAVVGGVTEYLSILHGFKALLLVTMVFYLAAFITARRGVLLAREPSPAYAGSSP